MYHDLCWHDLDLDLSLVSQIHPVGSFPWLLRAFGGVLTPSPSMVFDSDQSMPAATSIQEHSASTFNAAVGLQFLLRRWSVKAYLRCRTSVPVRDSLIFICIAKWCFFLGHISAGDTFDEFFDNVFSPTQGIVFVLVHVSAFEGAAWPSPEVFSRNILQCAFIFSRLVVCICNTIGYGRMQTHSTCCSFY